MVGKRVSLSRICLGLVLSGGLALLPGAVLCAAEPDRVTEEPFEYRWHVELSQVQTNPENQLRPFTTDGCSGGLSVGWEYLAQRIDQFRTLHGEQPPWAHCCISHDRVYHSAGGPGLSPGQSYEARREADLQLQQCVELTGSQRLEDLSLAYQMSEAEVARLYRIIGELMYRAVRLGGVPCSGLPWRWGYGWPPCN